MMDFLGDLGRKFSHAARSVTERTRENADLRAARSDLETRLADLGRAYYDSMTIEGCGVPEILLMRVREGIALVEALSGRREGAARQSRCSACGAVQGAEARFCSSCGRPMPDSSPVVEESVNDAEYCRSCGAMRGGESRFCEFCGAAFVRETETLPAPVLRDVSEKPEPPEEPDCTDPE